MAASPRITVLLPVHNCERYVRRAAESILAQTFRDFELLILDDGSTDGSRAAVETLRDPRIRFVANERNLGLVATLNRGLELTRAPYVARMDADDISHAARFAAQIDYLERHPDVAVLGTHCRVIDDHDRPFMAFVPPASPMLLAFRMCVEGFTPVYHPTVMFRTAAIRQFDGYRTDHSPADDGDLWFRVAGSGQQIANLPRRLLDYRSHGTQMTQTRSNEQVWAHARAHVRFLASALDVSIGADESRALAPRWFDGEHLRDQAGLEDLLARKRRIAMRFFATRQLSPAAVVTCVAHLWSSLFVIRKIDRLRDGYVRRLTGYCSQVLHEALADSSPWQRRLCQGLLLSRLPGITIRKVWDKARRQVR